MKVHAIGSLIASLEDLKAIHVRASRHARLQQVYVAAVPPELAGRSRVIDERSGALVLAADSSGVAAKLRQLMPRIVADIVKCCPEITAIRIEVQVTDGQRRGPPGIRPHIAAQGLDSFTRLRDALPESPLREALSRLVEHSARSHSEDDPLQNDEDEHDER
jgi:hypothetical protein